MLYLLSPQHAMRWANLPRSAVRLLIDQGTDLATMPWEPSDADDADLVLHVALRRGIPCSTGLVVLGEDLVLVRHPGQILQSKQNSTAAHTATADTDSVIAKLVPGWAEYSAQIDASADAAHRRAVREARSKAEPVLTEPENPALVHHWTSLGGIHRPL